MLSSYFTPLQQSVLASAVVLGAGAIAVRYTRHARWGIVLLTLAALILRVFAATLDPFLNYWDEAFHAAVAKNMVHHPFTPMLFTDPAMPVNAGWGRMHVWLHKPPFFLWQMALSIRIFGPEAWAVRLPSVWWTTLLVPVTYRMGRLLIDDRSAFAAAVLTTFSYYLQELTSGSISTDHNDAVFIGTVACSWWTLLEWQRSGRWGWALATGIFSACAVLTKWYVGLFVFLPWSVILLKRKLHPRVLRQAMAAFGCTALIAGSWIVRMWVCFPEEALYEWRFKSMHFSTAVAGHTGSWHFHFDVIADLVPPLAWWSVLPALAWLVFRIRSIKQRIILLTLVGGVHLFFLLAMNKMVSYTLVLLPFYAIAIGHALVSLTDLLPTLSLRNTIGALALVALAVPALDIERTQLRHTVYAVPRDEQLHRRQQLAVLAAGRS